MDDLKPLHTNKQCSASVGAIRADRQRLIKLIEVNVFLSVCLFCAVRDCSNSKQKTKPCTKNLTAKQETQIKILCYPALTLIRAFNNTALSSAFKLGYIYMLAKIIAQEINSGNSPCQ